MPVSAIKVRENSGSETATQTGQIYTDPDSGKSYHIDPDGMWMPIEEFDNLEAEGRKVDDAEYSNYDPDTIDPNSIKVIDEQPDGVKTVEVDGKRYYDYEYM